MTFLRMETHINLKYRLFCLDFKIEKDIWYFRGYKWNEFAMRKVGIISVQYWRYIVYYNNLKYVILIFLESWGEQWRKRSFCWNIYVNWDACLLSFENGHFLNTNYPGNLADTHYEIKLFI